MKKCYCLILGLLLIILPVPGPEEGSLMPAAAVPEPQLATTQQTVTINGQQIALTARAGTFLLRDENNEPIALFGFTSYTQNKPEPNC